MGTLLDPRGYRDRARPGALSPAQLPMPIAQHPGLRNHPNQRPGGHEVDPLKLLYSEPTWPGMPLGNWYSSRWRNVLSIRAIDPAGIQALYRCVD